MNVTGENFDIDKQFMYSYQWLDTTKGVLLSKEEHQAFEAATDALKQIAQSPIPFNYQEFISWHETAMNLARAALSQLKQTEK